MREKDFICNACRRKIGRQADQKPEGEIPDLESDVQMEAAVEQMQIDPVPSEASTSTSASPRLRPQRPSQPPPAPLYDSQSESSAGEAPIQDMIFDFDRIAEAVDKLFGAFNDKVTEKPMMERKDYSTSKLARLIALLRASYFKNAEKEAENEEKHFGNEIIDNLREKYHDLSTDRNLKFKILSIMPTTWTTQEIQDHMKATHHMAYTSQKLVKEHGIFFDIAKKTGSTKLDPVAKKLASAKVPIYTFEENLIFHRWSRRTVQELQKLL